MNLHFVKKKNNAKQSASAVVRIIKKNLSRLSKLKYETLDSK